jgi:hypothetical protein
VLSGYAKLKIQNPYPKSSFERISKDEKENAGYQQNQAVRKRGIDSQNVRRQVIPSLRRKYNM